MALAVCCFLGGAADAHLNGDRETGTEAHSSGQRETDTSSLLRFVSLFLGARELLRQSVLTLHAELGTGSRLLWKKWIRLEARYGDA